MKYQTIEVAYDEKIAFIYLNRPDVLNAINDLMMDEMIDAIENTRKDDNVHVLILSGKGRSFCAGADIKKFLAFQQEGKKQRDKSRPALVQVIFNYPKPVIAAINGPAFGGGFTMTLCCDIRLASDRAKFHIPFARIGLTPEWYSTYVLPRMIGYGKAAELAFTVKPFGADEAMEMGVINRVVPHDQLMEQAIELGCQISSMPPVTLQKTKSVLRYGMNATPEEAYEYECSVIEGCMEAKEHKEALAKLVDKMRL